MSYLKERLRSIVEHNPLFYELYQKAYRPISHAFDRRDGTPSWVKCPQDIQVDTHNYCSSTHEPDDNGNLIYKYPGCAFCNVKEGGAFGIPRGRMDDEMLDYIIDYWGKKTHLGAEYIAPYVNGDPILDNRLPNICDHSKDVGLKVCVDTSGNVYRNREWLVHENLTLLRFSISANTSETYEKVQGCPKFDEVMKTLEYVKENAYPSQQVELHFMVSKDNENELDDYIRRHKGLKIKIFPLHEMPDIQLNSTVNLPSNPEWINRGDTMEEWSATRPLFIYPNGKSERRVMDKNRTCQGMAYAIQWDGTILHCTDAPPSYNYGNVYEVDMLEAWHLRNKGRVENPACQACNAKRPDWLSVLEKYGLATPEQVAQVEAEKSGEQM